MSVTLGLRIPIVNGITDSLSCIPDFKVQDSETASRIPDSISENFPDCAIRIPIHEAAAREKLQRQRGVSRGFLSGHPSSRLMTAVAFPEMLVMIGDARPTLA